MDVARILEACELLVQFNVGGLDDSKRHRLRAVADYAHDSGGPWIDESDTVQVQKFRDFCF